MVDILKNFEPITLDQMSDIRLMNRIDKKFVTTIEQLHRLLDMAREEYYVQEVEGNRLPPYYTVYFDTDDCKMFVAHQNGHANRQKLRIRSYVESRLNFIEVKTKNNHGRTRKQRVGLAAMQPDQSDVINFCRDTTLDGYEEFLRSHLEYDHTHLSRHLENRFNRITLVNKGKTERLTIDTDLRFHNVCNGRRLDLDGLVVIELKRDGLVPSPVIDMLRRLHIKPMGFSKYCIGMAMTDSTIKQNLLKRRIHKVSRLMERTHRK